MIRPSKLDIGILDTPIKKYEYCGKDFFVKHDDLTGSLLLGNKVRKLDYLLFDAKQSNAEIILTCGGIQSNHARATVVAASMLGMKTKLFLFGTEPEVPEGNLFIDNLFNAEITYLTEEEYADVDALMAAKKKELNKAGFNVYIVPEGGSSCLGIWGYINFIDEIKKFVIENNITGIATACGSGGTTAGMLLGCAVNSLPLKIYSVNVLYPKDIIYNKIVDVVNECHEKYQIDEEVNYDNLCILDGFSEEGYTNITNEKIKVMNDFARVSGILFDPAYTGKAFYAYVQKILKGNNEENILFLHSGGLFGAFAKKEAYLEK